MKLDKDIKRMSHGKRGQELMRLRRLLRTHKAKENNARCWLNDRNLYDKALPEKSEGAGRMNLPEKVLLSNCRKYIRGQKCDMGKCPRKEK